MRTLTRTELGIVGEQGQDGSYAGPCVLLWGLVGGRALPRGYVPHCFARIRFDYGLDDVNSN